MSELCPHCGQHMPDTIFPEILLTKHQREILEVIHRAGSCGIDLDGIRSKVYPDRDDGGPEDAAVRMHIWAINSRIKHTRKRIKSVGWNRYQRGFYVLS